MCGVLVLFVDCDIIQFLFQSAGAELLTHQAAEASIRPDIAIISRYSGVVNTIEFHFFA